MTGQHHVKPDPAPSGGYPASAIVVGSDDSMYLFKQCQTANRRGSTPRQFLRDILSGTEAEVATVESQSQNNTYNYSHYDVTTYTGPLHGAVDAWLAAHPIQRHG